ncbi:MAG: NADH-quinone oxidoreductase subunit C, partial [Litoreibacter sp.]|nr:NADH-quinone oxidoreductase subunit C [Litoreibacter sp.]
KRPDCVLSWSVENDELTVNVAPASVVSFSEFLKTDQTCQFSTLVDMTAVDYPTRDNRFDMVYHFLSMYQNQRIRMKVAIREEEMLASIVDIFPAANWF